MRKPIIEFSRGRTQMFLRHIATCSVLLAFALNMSQVSYAQSQPGTVAPPETSPNRDYDDTLPIGPGDVINVQIFPGQELNQRIRVESDGAAQFLLVGKLRIAGLRPSQAAELMNQRLVDGGFLIHPSTSIFVEQYSRGIKIFGEVAKPSVYPPTGNGRISDLIAAAGGLSQGAGRDITITHSDRVIQHVNWEPDKVGDSAVDLQLIPGDSVYVPKATVFFIGGNVAKPGSYMLNPDEKLSVMQAIFLAGGTIASTSRHKSIIVRTTGNNRTVVHVNVTRIIEGKDPDPILSKNDILYVPPSNLKSQFKVDRNRSDSICSKSIYLFPLGEIGLQLRRRK